MEVLVHILQINVQQYRELHASEANVFAIHLLKHGQSHTANVVGKISLKWLKKHFY
jgi:hypothetical protein